MTLTGPFVKAEVIHKGPLWYGIRVYMHDEIACDTGDACWTRWGAVRKAKKWLVGERNKVTDIIHK